MKGNDDLALEVLTAGERPKIKDGEVEYYQELIADCTDPAQKAAAEAALARRSYAIDDILFQWSPPAAAADDDPPDLDALAAEQAEIEAYAAKADALSEGVRALAVRLARQGTQR